MCPLCLGTATLLVTSVTSAGGLAAVQLRQFFRKPCTTGSGAACSTSPQCLRP